MKWEYKSFQVVNIIAMSLRVYLVIGYMLGNEISNSTAIKKFVLK